MNRPVLRAVILTLLCLPFATAAADIIFTSPPREEADAGTEIYGPIAEFLTKTLGQPVVYQHPGNWLTYVSKMQRDEYDLVFDGPHFVSFRIAKFQHRPLVKLPGQLLFVVITRRDNQAVTELNDLAGRPVCGHAPPNLATLTLQAQYPNPTRQPRILETQGFKEAYQDMLDGKCEGTVLPTGIYKKLSEGDSAGLTRILFQSKPLPHQAISAGVRIPPDIQEKIRAALLTDAGQAATEKLRKRFRNGELMVPAGDEEYTGHAYLLSREWGFDL